LHAAVLLLLGEVLPEHRHFGDFMIAVRAREKPIRNSYPTCARMSPYMYDLM
jgi:hypothetical protein